MALVIITKNFKLPFVPVIHRCPSKSCTSNSLIKNLFSNEKRLRKVSFRSQLSSTKRLPIKKAKETTQVAILAVKITITLVTTLAQIRTMATKDIQIITFMEIATSKVTLEILVLSNNFGALNRVEDSKILFVNSVTK
ncbi:hypothetical protein Ddye_015151 [Dipteronia dyeriana]|uniref:Uncharacterized protein n=1 Tax=Dipteronia dyeriana TaxID=168575 RepID=A0AAD9U4D0_9ROSI|nr:hypothetical protein Ddye_015151 [Dipteronia dyeriana]